MAGCSVGSSKESQAGGTQEEKTQAVELTLSDYKFTTSTINTDVGTLLEVKLKNVTSQKHEMVINTPEGEYELEVDAGETVEFGMKFRQPGTYDFKCELPGHLDQGMKGQIVVKGKGSVAKFAKAKEEGEEKTQEVAVKLEDFKFSPGEVKTKTGTLLELGLTNASTQKHEMVVDGKSAEFEVEVEPGGTLGFAVKYRQKGSYEIMCELPGHLDQGMKGRIIVD